MTDADKTAALKTDVYKKSYSALLLCLDNKGYDNGDMLMAMSEERFLKWIMDSGGSYHMTPRRDFLFDLKEFINRACAIMGTGKVRVQMKDGSSFVRENLRYIPELKRNLIFLGTLNQEGYIVNLKNRRVKVCHKRLGHISEVRLHELEKRDVLGNKGLGKLEFCENYVVRKSSRVSFGRGQHTTEGVVDYIHADLRGPSRVESMSGSRSLSIALEKKTPMDLWLGHPVNYEMLRIFGCAAYSHVNQRKLNPRAIKCIFLGYPDDVKGYILWRLDDVKTKISISKDVVFNEGLMYMDTLKGTGTADSRKDVEFEVELQGSRVEPTMDPHSRENLKNKEEEAINSFENDEWVYAIKEEMSSLKKNHTWKLVGQPADKKLVSCKWLYKNKERIQDVQKPRYKARLVARRLTQ
nr:retrotransposon protein, putative, Ty1-copia subclass [Tanacetum cinerariifolium]